MDRRRALLLQLCNRPEMRRLFPCEPDQLVDCELLLMLERLWPVVREASASDEECVENIEMVLRITVSLADSGQFDP